MLDIDNWSSEVVENGDYGRRIDSSDFGQMGLNEAYVYLLKTS